MAANQEKLNYTIVEKLGMKFVISCTPRADNLQRWIELWNKEGVKNVVRACEPTYDVAELQAAGITLHVCSFSLMTENHTKNISSHDFVVYSFATGNGIQ